MFRSIIPMCTHFTREIRAGCGEGGVLGRHGRTSSQQRRKPASLSDFAADFDAMGASPIVSSTISMHKTSMIAAAGHMQQGCCMDGWSVPPDLNLHPSDVVPDHMPALIESTLIL